MATLSSAVQESLLAILCYDDSPGGAKSVAALVPAKAYDPYYKDLATAAKKYIRRYDAPPGEHTLDLIEQLKETRPKEGKIFDRLYESLELVRGSINREYVIDQTQRFLRHQELRSSLTDVVDLIQKGGVDRVDEVDAKLAQIVRNRKEMHADGIRLSDIERVLGFLDVENSDVFPTGIPELDKYDLGPARKALHLLAAPYSTGKSWWLLHLAKVALMHGYRVLYVSLEMDEMKLMQRMVQSLFSVTKRKEDLVRQVFEKDEDGRFVDFSPVRVKRRPHFASAGIRTKLKKKLDLFRRASNLMVTSFPSGSLTIDQLEGYLDTLEGSQGFLPDLLLVDYPALMKQDASNMRITMGRTYVDLRGIAQRRNIAVAAVSQINREGLGKAASSGKDLSEDISQAHTADVLLILNQTETEKALGLMRIFVDKAREDQSKFTVLLAQSFAMGQFVLDSVGQVRGYMERLADFAEEEDDG